MAHLRGFANQVRVGVWAVRGCARCLGRSAGCRVRERPFHQGLSFEKWSGGLRRATPLRARVGGGVEARDPQPWAKREQSPGAQTQVGAGLTGVRPLAASCGAGVPQPVKA